MREILFKAKRIDNGEWVEGYLFIKYYQESPHDRFVIQYKTTCDDKKWKPKYMVAEIDDSTICQYTGLTDKNGNKIWENDVVNKVDSNGLGWHRERKCKVSFDKLGYWLLTTEYGDGYWIAEFESEQLEVIGNVFDNPELLGGGE